LAFLGCLGRLPLRRILINCPLSGLDKLLQPGSFIHSVLLAILTAAIKEVLKQRMQALGPCGVSLSFTQTVSKAWWEWLKPWEMLRE